ncbi:ATP-binding protein [Geitlerinema sp. CS-897]|nr:ATP-binding protein [Geitlerinema sp. CS-897]
MNRDLTEIIRESRQLELEEDTKLRRARNLENQVIQISLIVSIALAIVLCIYTSLEITRPLKKVTQVAWDAAENGNFDRKASIDTKDEIGTLGTSIDYLIERVKQLLDEQIQANQQLESYSQNLEQQVRSRTQELQLKNSDLQNALQQLQQTQIQMVHSEKMSSLGQMVAGIAHEINNPVNFIHGNLVHADEYVRDLLGLVELYREQYPNPNSNIQDEIEAIELEFLSDDLPKLFQSMQVGTERIREIVKSLRIFSRFDEAEIKEVDLHEGIDSTLMILFNRLKAKPDRPAIEVVKHYGQLPKLECYPGQLNQVLMNLLSNAIDAVEENNKQRSYGEIQNDPNQIDIYTELENPDSIKIRIADNGLGIPSEIQDQLFNPFFTTKEVGKGTGLGLSISHQIIVEKHGGTLRCRSEVGRGAEFIIEIPRRQPQAST